MTTTPREVIASLIRNSYQKMLHPLLAAGASKEEADEALANVFVRIVANGWGDVENPLTYIRKAALREYARERLRRTRDYHRDRSYAADRTRQMSEDASLNSWEDREFVMSALNTLPPAARSVFALIYDGVPPQEIAELLGSNTNAVRQATHAARRLLKPNFPIAGLRRTAKETL